MGLAGGTWCSAAEWPSWYRRRADGVSLFGTYIVAEPEKQPVVVRGILLVHFEASEVELGVVLAKRLGQHPADRQVRLALEREPGQLVEVRCVLVRSGGQDDLHRAAGGVGHSVGWCLSRGEGARLGATAQT